MGWLHKVEWKGLIQQLHESGQVDVNHSPLSPRYDRAQETLDAIVFDGQIIAVGIDTKHRCPNIAVWISPDPEDIFCWDSFGKYAVIRVFGSPLSPKFIPEYAEVFCFYDGIDEGDDPGNLQIIEMEEALQVAQNFGYEAYYAKD